MLGFLQLNTSVVETQLGEGPLILPALTRPGNDSLQHMPQSYFATCILLWGLVLASGSLPGELKSLNEDPKGCEVNAS